MEAALSIAIGVGVFVVAAIIYSKFIVKSATLATLPALEGEGQEAALVLPLGGALTQRQTMRIYSKQLPELRGVLSLGDG